MKNKLASQVAEELMSKKATSIPPTEAPATEAPATEAPATEAPSTEAPAMEAPAMEAQGSPLRTPMRDSVLGHRAPSWKWMMYRHGAVITMTTGYLENNSEVKQIITEISWSNLERFKQYFFSYI